MNKTKKVRGLKLVDLKTYYNQDGMVFVNAHTKINATEERIQK